MSRLHSSNGLGSCSYLMMRNQKSLQLFCRARCQRVQCNNSRITLYQNSRVFVESKVSKYSILHGRHSPVSTQMFKRSHVKINIGPMSACFGLILCQSRKGCMHPSDMEHNVACKES
ncbi:expressed protein [Batrachochytrium dendrobatidis JAM81]|uniref:Expressed protein n=1 Tax=Batrachochytrium dendrobatidis (strain JAM81 / FGSC 10211) TaxID=684364 RepID=F4PBJ3_BATDJ|nr:uncharacterized protein BATDEDRAFT_37435 [Batrachochytrium dendrobatidis JAM81]EGF77332.1 expressed protein [Batrachochytrium dendrobatidis JAM81]|eukprot:XP_006682015.1 expressed protein [Batrachochytrium dendrobatidis JAM81]